MCARLRRGRAALVFVIPEDLVLTVCIYGFELIAFSA